MLRAHYGLTTAASRVAQQLIFAVVVAVTTAIAGGYESATGAEWAFDGYIYGIRAQVDARIVLTILANPIPTDVARVVVFPALIPLACGSAIAAQAALVAGRASAPDAPIVGQWSGSESILAVQRPKSSPLV